MNSLTKSRPKRQVTSPIKKLFGMSLASQIIVGLIIGIVVGIFFGQRCSVMRIPADIFITFLQIPVIPYVLFSLIHGIGSLNKKVALRLAGLGGMVLLLFWCLSLFYVIASQLAFPDWKSRMFFSAAKSVQTNVNYYYLYIPSNPFYSLANELVPAIVVFSLLVGCCLIGIEQKRKRPLLDLCELLVDIMSKLTHKIVRFTPLGVFAMAANAAGTLTIEEFSQIQIYIIVFILSALLLSFFALPLLVSVLTPFRYRDFLRVSKDAMMTAFTTGSLLVILPLVASGIKELMTSYGCYDQENKDLQQTILPVYFNFPDSGKMLVLIFVLFASWYTGGQLMPPAQYPIFLTSGVFGMFASANVTIPFLLSLFNIQPAMFQIYLMAGIFNGNFSSLTAAVDIFAFTILCICSMRGLLKFKLKSFILTVILIIAVSISLFWGVGGLLEKYFKPKDYIKEKLMSMNISDPVQTKIIKQPEAKSKIFKWKNINLLKEIIKRRIIKVGYLPSRIPFSYQNDFLPEKEKSVLQGLDAAIINNLARELNCKLVYYPLTEKQMYSALNNNQVDIAIGGIGITFDTVDKYELTNPIFTLHPAIIARYDHISQFNNLKKIKERTGLVLAYSHEIISNQTLHSIFPKAKLIQLDDPADFYTGKIKADACVLSAEEGAAFSIIYPQFSYSTKPEFTNAITLTAFAVNKNQFQLIEFLNNWIAALKASGSLPKYYDSWV